MKTLNKHVSDKTCFREKCSSGILMRIQLKIAVRLKVQLSEESISVQMISETWLMQSKSIQCQNWPK